MRAECPLPVERVDGAPQQVTPIPRQPNIVDHGHEVIKITVLSDHRTREEGIQTERVIDPSAQPQKKSRVPHAGTKRRTEVTKMRLEDPIVKGRRPATTNPANHNLTSRINKRDIYPRNNDVSTKQHRREGKVREGIIHRADATATSMTRCRR